MMSRPVRVAPAYTEHRHPKSFDLQVLTKFIYGKSSHSVSSLRDRRTRLDPYASGEDSSIASGRTSELEFNCTTKRGIPSPEAIQSNSGKDNKQYVRRIGKKWIQQENRISKGWYYWNKPKINGYRQQMHSM